MFADLRRRSITAGVLILGIIALLLAANTCLGSIALVALAVFVLLCCCFEFSRFRTADPIFLTLTAILAIPGLVLAGWSLGQFGICALEWRAARGFGMLMAAALFSAFFGALVIAFAARAEIEKVADYLKRFVPAWYLIGVGGGSLIGLAGSSNIQGILIWLLLVVCANDIAAYFVGQALGGQKLAPAISPGKTISGTCGGLLVGTLTGGLAASLLPYLHGVWVLLVPLIVTLAAQLGDLTESYLKRIHGLKDSGSILPGHGGLFDRVDAILGAAPFVYCWLFFNSWL